MGTRGIAIKDKLKLKERVLAAFKMVMYTHVVIIVVPSDYYFEGLVRRDQHGALCLSS